MCGFWSWELCISSVVPRLWDASDASGTQVNKDKQGRGAPTLLSRSQIGLLLAGGLGNAGRTEGSWM